MVSRIVSRPGFIEPQLPTLVDVPPEGDDWIHEVKYDGYRKMAEWLKPGTIGRVRHLKGEEKPRHATLKEMRT